MKCCLRQSYCKCRTYLNGRDNDSIEMNWINFENESLILNRERGKMPTKTKKISLLLAWHQMNWRNEFKYRANKVGGGMKKWVTLSWRPKRCYSNTVLLQDSFLHRHLVVPSILLCCLQLLWIPLYYLGLQYVQLK